MKDLVAEHLDHVHYLNDILCLRIENLNEVLTSHLLNRLFIPLYVYSLTRSPVQSGAVSLEVSVKNPGENLCDFLEFPFFQDMKPHVSKVTALFLLSQVFLIITHVPLVRLLAWIIFHGNSDVFTERGAARILEYSSTTTKASRKALQQQKSQLMVRKK